MAALPCPFCPYTARKDNLRRHIATKHPREEMDVVENVRDSLSVIIAQNGDYVGICWSCHNTLPGRTPTVESARNACRNHKCRVIPETAVPATAAAATVPATLVPAAPASALDTIMADPAVAKLIATERYEDDDRTDTEVIITLLRMIPRLESRLRQTQLPTEELKQSFEQRLEAAQETFEHQTAQLRRDLFAAQQAVCANDKRIGELETECRAHEHNTRILQAKLAAQTPATQPIVTNGFRVT